MLRQPCELPTRETVEFVAGVVGPARRHILEVGCGQGEVAARLGQLGHQVLAVDSRPENVEAARRRGVEAEEARWPDFGGGPFDVVLFTRSLHHIHPLEPAVTKAANMLEPGGQIVLEDFAFQEADEAMVSWFYRHLRELDRQGHLIVDDESFASRILAAKDKLEAWHHGHAHDHELHSWASMREATAADFTLTLEARVPYVYRYLVEVLESTARGARMLESFLQAESMTIQRGDLLALGRRLVGTRR